MSAEISVPGFNNARASLSVPSRDMESMVGDVAMAAELAKQEGMYIIDNLNSIHGLAPNVFGRDADRVQFELNHGVQANTSVTNAPQLNEWLADSDNVRPDDYMKVIFPELDTTQNYVQTVIDSQANLAREILELPAHVRHGLERSRRIVPVTTGTTGTTGF